MKKFLLVPILILPAMIFASNVNFWSIYNMGLNQNPTYQNANLQLIQAQNNLNAVNSVFYPTLSLTTSALTLNSSGVSVTSQLNFTFGLLNLYSTQIGLSLPLNLNNFSFGNLYISASRNLIVENGANLMEAKSSYSNALWNLEVTKWSYLNTLVQNIFNWYFYQRMIDLYSQEVQVLEDVYKSINPLNQSQQNNAYQQLLSAQTSLQNYKNSMLSIQSLPNFTPYSTELYKDTISFVSSLTSNVSTNVDVGQIVSQRQDVQALEYQYKAYKYQADLWYLPFIPNPSITFLLPVNNPSKWSLSLSLNFSILNGGLNILESQQRLTNVSIGQENLQNATTTDILSLNGLFLNQKTLQINLLAAQNSVQTVLQNFQTIQALYEKGLESFDDYALANINYQIALLNQERVQQQILLNKIQIMQMEGMPFGGETI
ncbi:TolC family protein [Athalassotoga saccharophila]|uniref:TolC family protein n=1 Tax=Athalassotoga saccharophila TaxID=1441386 RepID=UPI001379F306|nr:TolC family protein [Athalassotoga saccharophila]BBJ27150.1 hypothetical protein ATHSA_0017 [Athalassotoga saccharophila]